jgi:hypothetical protein
MTVVTVQISCLVRRTSKGICIIWKPTVIGQFLQSWKCKAKHRAKIPVIHRYYLRQKQKRITRIWRKICHLTIWHGDIQILLIIRGSRDFPFLIHNIEKEFKCKSIRKSAFQCKLTFFCCTLSWAREIRVVPTPVRINVRLNTLNSV